MRKTTLEAWKNKIIDRGAKPKLKSKPSAPWKLRDSIIYIRMRNEYLGAKGILIKTGEREYLLKPERSV